jgi:SAM-dependent methyltransferase
VEIADYQAGQVGGEAALAFYLQQGAGLWSITSNLAELDRPVGTRLLEIGCGFGFGLDFARRALHWEVLGLDPSPIAAAGRAQLGLPIQSRYLVIDDPALAKKFDVVMASEVIEHVASPLAFARTLKSTLREGGTLVLTTPDVEAVSPATPPGQLVPLLSVGFHLVLQSPRSLELLLAAAGFEDIHIHRVGGASLHARARCGTGAAHRPLRRDRALYWTYLGDSIQAAVRDGDLWFGMTARAYREAVSAADCPAADRLWDDLSAACQRRFGWCPDVGAPHPPPAHRSADEALGLLVAHEPLCLGPMLLYRGYHRLLAGDSRSTVEALFERAAQACFRLRRALQCIGSDDGDAEDIAWIAQAEALLCAAERSAPDVPKRFAVLGTAPGDVASQRDHGLRRTDQFRRRIFVTLVNVGQNEEAGRLPDIVTEILTRAASPGVLLDDDELDGLFCGAVHELQRNPSAPERALELLGCLQTACAAARAAGRTGSAETLVSPALDAERLALELLGHKPEGELGGEETEAQPTGTGGVSLPMHSTSACTKS